MVVHHPPQAGHDGVDVRVGPHPGGVEEQLLAPHQAGVAAQLHHVLEEAPEDPHAQALPELAQGGVVGERLVLGLGTGDAPGEFGRLGLPWPAVPT